MKLTRSDRNLRPYIISVIVAVIVFATTSLVLPGIEDRATVLYQVFLFVFTFSGIVLLFFAGTLIVAGALRIYFLVCLLLTLYKKR